MIRSVRGALVGALVALAYVTLPLTAQQRVVRGTAVDPTVAIRIWVPDGMIEVHGWDRDSVEVRATPDAMTQLITGGSRSAMKVAIERRDLKLTPMASAQMRVYVPRGARLWIKSTTAAVQVEGLTGELDVLQVGGGINVREVSGVTTLESIDGPMSLARVAGVTRIRGGAGAVALDAMTGSLDISMIGGRVTLSGPPAARGGGPRVSGRIETVGGEIWFLAGLATGDRMELSSHSGPIRISARGEMLPRVVTTLPDAVIDPRLLEPRPAGGTITVRSFKGTLNATVSTGI
ncbi:MAG TPA: hypothetical protein VFN22_03130 [Gemmatimonadales bacterium]|nr:hypothetical protein [Gemmatimonadales bacterium]